MNRRVLRFLPALPLAMFAAATATGCIHTTHEIKPIHITMDINLKINKDLDDFFGDLDNTTSIPSSANAQK